ncbi:hypothetical protein F7725_027052 [Dissostichus mawsoni]|uniref:WD repeat domain 74 n=1 Tax=Dissostichus mawsoni TaxID=36200 RepID=A0A7J5XBW4_DISMA|nr:hypothetical protein F7725_027052 [Dissostichus mawsoni]
MADSSRLCSVFLGSETGILKGVSLSRKQAFNFCNTQHLSRDQEVRVLVWGDRAETDLLLGARDGSVKTFSLEKGSFTETRSCGDPQEGGFTGLEVWRESSSDPVAEVITGKNVSRMRQNPAQRNKMATGGKENGLKIWDLENPKNPPVFSAKNLKDDWLDLKRAQWVRDIAFIPQSEKVVTCTGYHQRRPVMEMEFGDHPLTALSLPTGGTSVVVGNTRGEVAVLDLRKGLVRGVLKGLCGGVRALQCHPSLPIVASCGLDRFLRIHSLEDRKLQHKVYLKSRLNCLLLASQREEWGGGAGAGGEEVKKEEEEEEEEDEVWENMERVEEQGKRKSTTEEEEEEETLKKKKSKKGED